MKPKAKLIWLLGVISGFAAAVLAFFWGKKQIDAEAKKKASDELAENLKAKVAEVKAAAAARKEETNAAVAKVDEAVQVDAARDPVELANDLIRGAGKGG